MTIRNAWSETSVSVGAKKVTDVVNDILKAYRLPQVNYEGLIAPDQPVSDRSVDEVYGIRGDLCRTLGEAVKQYGLSLPDNWKDRIQESITGPVNSDQAREKAGVVGQDQGLMVTYFVVKDMVRTAAFKALKDNTLVARPAHISGVPVADPALEPAA